MNQQEHREALQRLIDTYRHGQQWSYTIGGSSRTEGRARILSAAADCIEATDLGQKEAELSGIELTLNGMARDVTVVQREFTQILTGALGPYGRVGARVEYAGDPFEVLRALNEGKFVKDLVADFRFRPGPPTGPMVDPERLERFYVRPGPN